MALDGKTVAVSVDVAPTLRERELRETVMPVTGTRTVTVQVAFWPPLDVAVIVAVPAPIAVTLPPETVATEALEVVQVTVLSVASDGETVAVNVEEPPTLRVSDDWLIDMPVVGMSISHVIKTAPGLPASLKVSFIYPPRPMDSLYDSPGKP